ncbi:hypothetical protein BJX65DRAFT_272847 [Aspergillus insuetus]
MCLGWSLQLGFPYHAQLYLDRRSFCRVRYLPKATLYLETRECESSYITLTALALYHIRYLYVKLPALISAGCQKTCACPGELEVFMRTTPPHRSKDGEVLLGVRSFRARDDQGRRRPSGRSQVKIESNVDVSQSLPAMTNPSSQRLQCRREWLLHSDVAA